MIHRLAAAPRALAVLAAALLVTLLSAGSVSAAGPASTPGPGYHQPTIGECRDLSWEELYQRADPQPVVDCATAHSARTIEVRRLPDDVEENDQERIDGIARSRCGHALIMTLGKTPEKRAMVAYDVAYYVPTAGEWANGARWLRCDLILLGGHRLEVLPTDREPALPGGNISDSIRRCLAGKAIAFTACTRTHQWRATGAFVLHQPRYPDDARSYPRLARKCAPLVNTSKVYRWTFPSKFAWRTGNHAVTCYSKTTR